MWRSVFKWYLFWSARAQCEYYRNREVFTRRRMDQRMVSSIFGQKVLEVCFGVFCEILWTWLAREYKRNLSIMWLLNKIIYCSFVWFNLVTSKTRSERIFCWFLTQVIDRHWWFLHKLSRSTLGWVPRLTDWKHLPLVLDEIEAGVLWRGAKSAGS